MLEGQISTEKKIPPFSIIRNAYFKAFKNGKTNFLRKKIIGASQGLLLNANDWLLLEELRRISHLS